jgi:glycosyltransferase involved in cell wall biosynthesis
MTTTVLTVQDGAPSARVSRSDSAAAVPEIEFSIVMPCLNEAETLETCIVKARRALEKHHITGEIVVADNGSTDGSAQIAARLGARVIFVETKGYGSALMGGITAARGKYVIMGDADDSYDFANLEPFIVKLRDGYDLVMGNRFAGGIKPGAMPFLNRYLGNPVLTAIARLLFYRPAVHDFHCGLRGFSREAVLGMNLRTTGMEFASEIVVKAVLNQLRITEVPTTLSPDGRRRPSHLRRWRDGWRHLRFLLLYCPRWLFVYPGSLLMAVGVAAMFSLLPGPRAIRGAVFDVHTLLFAAAAIIVGFQAVFLGIFTKIFGVVEGLLPRDRRLEIAFRYVNLEVGIGVGATLFIAGFLLALYGVRVWELSGFGPLSVPVTLRIAIPSVCCMILGAQIILCSFVLSFIGLRRWR